jgi:hypothetical protein
MFVYRLQNIERYIFIVSLIVSILLLLCVIIHDYNQCFIFSGKSKAKKKQEDVTVEEITDLTEAPAPSSYVCLTCKIHGEADDELNGIEWFQCDFCPEWYHYHCLPAGHQARVDLSLLCVDEVQWACPQCADTVHRICQVCLGEEDLFGALTNPTVGSDKWAGCNNDQCGRWYHLTCLPERYNSKWYCPGCLEE